MNPERRKTCLLVIVVAARVIAVGIGLLALGTLGVTGLVDERLVADALRVLLGL